MPFLWPVGLRPEHHDHHDDELPEHDRFVRDALIRIDNDYEKYERKSRAGC
jgi:hypothetical protein